MIQKRAAIGGSIERPTEGVLNVSRFVFSIGDAPNLFQTNAVSLVLNARTRAQSKPINDLQGQMTATAFRKKSATSMELHPPSEFRLQRPVFRNTYVVRSHATNCA